MTKEPVIRENDRMEIYSPQEKLYYKTLVQAVNDDTIAIGVPMAKNRRLFLKEDSVWTCCLVAEDALYYFKGVVLGRITEQVELIVLRRPTVFQRKQRRRFVRFNHAILLDCWFWLWEREEGRYPLPHRPITAEEYVRFMKENNLGRPFQCMGVDISGGGLQVTVPQSMEVGDLLLMALYLDLNEEERILLLKGAVVRIDYHRRGGQNLKRYGIEFRDILEDMQETIVQFIFQAMRKRLL